MTEPSPVYYADLIPTKAELKLLSRLRKSRGLYIVDSDSMTLWEAPRAEYCNGRHAPTLEESIIEARHA